MPTSMRIELFPCDMKKFLDFYVGILQFQIVRHDGAYAFIRRDEIFLSGAEAANTDSLVVKESYRRPDKGVEIVFEVDDLVGERDRVVAQGGSLDADIKMQPWGLEDFRLVDPDGYYVRITTHSPEKNAKGVGQSS